jgi:hypothetical protein
MAEGAAGAALTTSPVELFKQSDPISQYPAGHRGPVGFWDWAVAEAAAGAALTTSPVELFKQSDPISQYPAGHRGPVGFWDWAGAVQNQQVTMPIVAKACLADLMYMIFSMVGGDNCLGARR